MPTKSLDRLLFVQGGSCFFCARALDKADASVEHLLAASRGGGNGDDNCVACCKSINTLFGSMSLKEKFQVLLNQRGSFECPNGRESPQAPRAAAASEKSATVKKVQSVPAVAAAAKPLDVTVSYLKNLKKAKPAKMATLESTIRAQLKLSEKAAADVIRQLTAAGKLKLNGTKLEYHL